MCGASYQGNMLWLPARAKIGRDSCSILSWGHGVLPRQARRLRTIAETGSSCIIGQTNCWILQSLLSPLGSCWGLWPPLCLCNLWAVESYTAKWWDVRPQEVTFGPDPIWLLCHGPGVAQSPHFSDGKPSDVPDCHEHQSFWASIACCCQTPVMFLSGCQPRSSLKFHISTQSVRDNPGPMAAALLQMIFRDHSTRTCSVEITISLLREHQCRTGHYIIFPV